MKTTLELGVGLHPSTPSEEAYWHDREFHAPFIDVAWDLNLIPWPWDDEQFHRIVALDVVEHLRADVSDWLYECHRILKPGGRLEIRVPHYASENFYTDSTHRQAFALRTFDYWDHSKELYQKYGCYYWAHHNRWWSIQTAFHNVEEQNLYFTLVRT